MKEKILIALTILLLGCINQNTEQGIIEVHVEDFETQEPLENVLIKAGEDLENTTNAQGKASLKLTPGEHDLEISSSGYSTQNKKVSIEKNTLKTLKITLVSDSFCEPVWNCTGWTECLGGRKHRTCIDLNECGSDKGKPKESQNCYSPPEPDCITNSDCADTHPCTEDLCSNGSCVNRNITACISKDDCCPEGCGYMNDTDCPEIAECKVDKQCETNQTCKYGYCYKGKCKTADIASCTDEDGCCPEKCTYLEDDDCPECTEKWNCTAWTACQGGERTRECTDENNCGTEQDKPEEVMDCCESDDDCASNQKCNQICVLKNCTEQQGVICGQYENCSEEYINASDTDYCCPGTCILTKGDLYFVEGSFDVSGEEEGTFPKCSQEDNDNTFWFEINSTFTETVPNSEYVGIYHQIEGQDGGVTHTVNFPGGLQPGINKGSFPIGSIANKNITLRLDEDDVIDESNEGNNEFIVLFSMDHTDLTVDSVNYNTTTSQLEVLISREPITYDCPWFTVRMNIDGENFFQDTIPGFGNTGDNSLMLITQECSEPQEVTVTIDVSDNVHESNENNNEFEWP